MRAGVFIILKDKGSIDHALSMVWISQKKFTTIYKAGCTFIVADYKIWKFTTIKFYMLIIVNIQKNLAAYFWVLVTSTFMFATLFVTSWFVCNVTNESPIIDMLFLFIVVDKGSCSGGFYKLQRLRGFYSGLFGWSLFAVIFYWSAAKMPF